MDFQQKIILIDGQRVKIRIWGPFDTRENFGAWRPWSAYRGVNGFFVVYDVTSGKSFERLKKDFLPEIDKYCDKQAERFLVGNKCDDFEHREVLEADARRFAEQMNMQFFETSAKDNTNVEEMFNTIARLVLDAKLKSPRDQSGYQGMGHLIPRDQRQKSHNSYCTLL